MGKKGEIALIATVILLTLAVGGVLISSNEKNLGGYAYHQNWWDSSFTKCRDISIQNFGGKGLVDFPSYIYIDYDSDMQTDYDDIRFVSEPCGQNGKLLAFELDQSNSEGAGYWVKTTLPAEGKTISVYYGNSQADNTENPTQVWDPDFVMVQHLQETTGTHFDSTTHENNGINEGSLQDAEGKIGKANEFFGVAESINVADNPSFDLTSALTVEAWVKNNDLSQIYSIIAGKYATDRREWAMRTGNSDGKLMISFGGESGNYAGSQTSDNTVFDSVSTWYYISFTYNEGSIAIYKNGEIIPSTGSIPTTLNNENEPIRIGKGGNGQKFPYNGKIDEVRISKIARSTNWINQQYQNIKNPPNTGQEQTL